LIQTKPFSLCPLNALLRAMKKSRLVTALLLTAVSLTATALTCVANFGLFISNPQFSQSEASFLEGIMLMIIGILFILGSGGLNLASKKAVELARALGPSETFRRDRWKPKGFTRLGIVLVMTGIEMLLVFSAQLSFVS